MDFEKLVIDILAEKANGRLKATVLVQKRARELERGWPALVPAEAKNVIHIAVEEFQADKISLALGEEAEKLRADRMVEERERTRALEAARRAEADASLPGANRAPFSPLTRTPTVHTANGSSLTAKAARPAERWPSAAVVAVSSAPASRRTSVRRACASTDRNWWKGGRSR
jgi:DNA-directed RNA polymerase subunit K/omega